MAQQVAQEAAASAKKGRDEEGALPAQTQEDLLDTSLAGPTQPATASGQRLDTTHLTEQPDDLWVKPSIQPQPAPQPASSTASSFRRKQVGIKKRWTFSLELSFSLSNS